MARKRSYQKGNVQMHNGQWTLRYREWDYDQLRWVQKRVLLEGTFKNQKEARRASDPLMVRVNKHNNEGQQAKNPPSTFAQFVTTRFAEYQQQQQHQVTTLETYERLLRLYILPALGDKGLSAVTPAHISDLLERVSEKSANTRNLIYSLCHVIFDLALQYDLIAGSPVRPKVHRPTVERKEKPTLTPEQIRDVVSNMPERHRLMLLLLALTGKRIGEILALRWCDFDKDRSELAINHTLYKGKLKRPKSESSKGIVRLDVSIAGSLYEHWKESPYRTATDFIFCEADGKPHDVHNLRFFLVRAMERAGIERIKGQHGFHIFRHSAGSLLYAKTNDLKLVQQALGHSRSQITSDLYIHLQEQPESSASSILAEVLDIADRKKDKAG